METRWSDDDLARLTVEEREELVRRVLAVGAPAPPPPHHLTCGARPVAGFRNTVATSTLVAAISTSDGVTRMTELLLVPVDDNVIFPGMTVVVPAAEVGAEEGEQVLLVPRHEGRFATVGTVADVTGRTRLPNGVTAVQLT